MRAIMTLGFLAVLLSPAYSWAQGGGQGWEQRRDWDWGQHRTSLFAEEEPRGRTAPTRSHDHWDDPAAPVRVADR